MPRASVTKNYFNFIGGKHTDGSPLNSIENTASILENVDLHPSGKINRRLGLDFEEGHAFTQGPFTEAALRDVGVDFLEWTNVAGDGRRNFYVVRMGHDLFIYDQSGEAPSSELLGTENFLGLTIDAAESINAPIQVVSAKGFLIVTGEFIQPFKVTFDTIEKTFEALAITIEIRDFEGIEEKGLPLDFRPGVLTTNHRYNLENQGWGKDVVNFETKDNELDLVSFQQQSGQFPSNVDIASLAMTPNPDDEGELQFRASAIEAKYLGDSRAPNGHFILNGFARDQDASSGIPVSGGLLPFLVRPRSVEFFAGRAWYGGVKGNIYFSQILTKDENIGRCYQKQDPTSEEANELLDTDGGVIPLPDAGEIYKLIAIGNSVLVMASNGIWGISGGEANFTANSTSVVKVSDIGINAPASVVRVENSIFFWSDEGIFVITADQISGQLNSQPVSANRIDRDLNLIPSLSKISSQASYDRVDKKIYWSYHDGLNNTAARLESKYNSVVVYDVTLNAFYDYRIEDSPSSGGSFMAGMVKPSIRNEGQTTENVTVNDVQVTANGIDVTTTVTFTGASTLRPKVLTFAYDPITDDYEITFSEYCSRSFTDWLTEDGVGVNYTSIIETNPESLGEASLDKGATYLTTFYDHTRDGYGSALSNPRPDATTGWQVSHAPVEVLGKSTTLWTVSQAPVEVLGRNEAAMRVVDVKIEFITSEMPPILSQNQVGTIDQHIAITLELPPNDADIPEDNKKHKVPVQGTGEIG